MTNESYTPADFDSDYAKEARFMELGAERLMTPAPHRPQYIKDNEPGQELDEVYRINVDAVDVETDLYDEQNN
jgi:hypothetical protein